MLHEKLLTSEEGRWGQRGRSHRHSYHPSPLEWTGKGEVVRFLNEAGLIDAPEAVVFLEDADLRDATLTDANLTHSHLPGADLSAPTSQAPTSRAPTSHPPTSRTPTSPRP